MSERTYVWRRLELSSHIVRTHTRLQNGWVTLCGRRIIMEDSAAVGVLPAGRSCESCLRIATRAEDRRTEDDGSTHDELVP